MEHLRAYAQQLQKMNGDKRFDTGELSQGAQQ